MTGMLKHKSGGMISGYPDDFKFMLPLVTTDSDDDLNNLNNYINDGIAEYGDVSFPYMWSTSDGYNNERPDDPLTMYLTLSTGGHDDYAVFSFTLSDVLNDWLWGLKDGNGTLRLGNNDKKALSDFRKSLISMADHVSDLIKPKRRK
jgi:hypothetical protein